MGRKERYPTDKMLQKSLFEVLSSDYRGPRAGFTNAHVLKALFLIGEYGEIGRGRLGQLLEMGQGEIRTLIRRLKSGGLIAVGDGGCSLTKFGQTQYKVVSRAIPWMGRVDGDSLKLGKFCFALIVKGKSGRVRKGIEQRDEAIKAGATAALTVLYIGGKFTIPNEKGDCESSGQSEPWATIRSSKNLKEGDVVIITGASSTVVAEHAGLAAALDLIQK